MKKNMFKFLIAFALMLSVSTNLSADCNIDDRIYPTGYLFPNSTFYEKYFECTEAGHWVERECITGLWFNPATWQCDFPWNVPFPGVPYPGM